MRALKTVLAVLTIALCAAVLVRPAAADDLNKMTKITFSQPVEIPGRILPAGTYIFKLIIMQGVRNIVQISNEDDNKVITTILAIHDYRLKSTKEPVIEFRERPSNAPAAVRAWFYAFQTAGLEFVYPKARAVELAAQQNVPVPAEQTEATTPARLETVPLVAEMPGNTEEPITQAFETTPARSTNALMAQELPKTASPLPLIGLVGLISIGLGAGLRLAIAMQVL